MFRHTLAAAALAAASAAHAEPVHYDFNDPWGNPLGAATTPAHLQASAASIYGPDGVEHWICSGSSSSDYACGGFGDSTLSFSIAVDAGWKFNVNSFTFQGLGTSDLGPGAFAVYSSLDGFAQALLEGDLRNQVVQQRYDYDAGFTAHDLHGPLEMRIVSTGGPTTGWRTSWLLDNLRLDVTITQDNTVPEPGSLPLLAMALMAAVATRAAGRRHIRR